MIQAISALHKSGVIGINRRNLTLISEYNSRRDMRLVDDKTITKKLAKDAGIPTPGLYGLVERARDCSKVDRYFDSEAGAVIKPAKGSQGQGILIITDKHDAHWRRGNGDVVDPNELNYHTINVISGMFSLGGQPDVAMVEERIQFNDVFSEISFKGVPDIRVITLKGVPIASMLRLPTKASDGKANLHRGGVGTGIKLYSGKTFGAMQNGVRVTEHPDTHKPLNDVQVPHWETILEMSARAFDMTGLGYLGVDIVLDKERGPLLLELNARPGIAIQIANGKGLQSRVDRVTTMQTSHLNAQQRAQVGQMLSQNEDED